MLKRFWLLVLATLAFAGAGIALYNEQPRASSSTRDETKIVFPSTDWLEIPSSGVLKTSD